MRAWRGVSFGFPRPFRHECVLKLGDRAENLGKHPPDCGRGIDALVKHHQIDTAFLQAAGQADQVLQGAAKPVELGHHKLVTGAGDQQRPDQRGPPGELTRGLVNEHLVTAGRRQRVVLGGGVLVTGGYPPVADPHGPRL